MTHPRDPRHRRTGFAPVDARAAAGRLEAAADAMRAEQLDRGNAEEPPTGLLDLAAIRAALGADPGEDVNPAAVRWLAGDDEPDEGTEFDTDGTPCPRCGGDAGHESWCTWRAQSAPAPEHAHPYFVEGCAACVAAAEEAERAEEEARAAAAHREAIESAPLITAEEFTDAVTVAEEPEPEASPAPAPVVLPVAPVPPPEPAPVAVPVFRSEHAGERALTWRSRHDERSRGFGVRREISVSAPLTDHVWPVGPVLDQGAEGACVGFASVDAWTALDARASALADDALADDALQLYRRAQQLDEVPGEAYTGTSVLAGMKAGVERGLFGGYLWAFGTKDVAQAVLQRGPVVVGIPWPESWFDAPADGLLTLDGADTGDLGHCLAVVGILLTGPRGLTGPYFVLQNSYGPGWGHQGFGYVHHRDLARLLRDRGEAAIPTREAPRV